MQKRNKIILIVVGLLLIGVVLFLAIWTRPSGTVTGPSNEQRGAAQNVGAETEAPAAQQIETRQPSAEEIARAQLTTLSQSFAERFGTYSNDGNFQNVIDLYPQMTSSMADWAKNYVIKMRSEASTEGYEGATTRAISTGVTSLDLSAGKAETLVKTQRVTAKAAAGGKIESETLYQDLRLELVKIGADWKIDGAYWVK
jgi:hypothetical protein